MSSSRWSHKESNIIQKIRIAKLAHGRSTWLQRIESIDLSPLRNRRRPFQEYCKVDSVSFQRYPPQMPQIPMVFRVAEDSLKSFVPLFKETWVVFNQTLNWNWVLPSLVLMIVHYPDSSHSFCVAEIKFNSCLSLLIISCPEATCASSFVEQCFAFIPWIIVIHVFVHDFNVKVKMASWKIEFYVYFVQNNVFIVVPLMTYKSVLMSSSIMSFWSK